MWPGPIRCGKGTSLPCQLDAICLLDGRSVTALASDGAKPGAGRALRRRQLLSGYVKSELQSRSPLSQQIVCARPRYSADGHYILNITAYFSAIIGD